MEHRKCLKALFTSWLPPLRNVISRCHRKTLPPHVSILMKVLNQLGACFSPLVSVVDSEADYDLHCSIRIHSSLPSSLVNLEVLSHNLFLTLSFFSTAYMSRVYTDYIELVPKATFCYPNPLTALRYKKVQYLYLPHSISKHIGWTQTVTFILPAHWVIGKKQSHFPHQLIKHFEEITLIVLLLCKAPMVQQGQQL